MSISENLKHLREENGYSQENLAQKLNISRQSISKWELGKSNPDINYLIELSKIYNISLDDIVSDNLVEKHLPVPKENIFSKGLRFYIKDFKYRHTDPNLVKIKTIGWLVIIGAVIILTYIK